MKKMLLLLVSLISLQNAFADDAANIKIRISGALSDNRYFLCTPDTGCLSILDGQRKSYPIFHTVDMSSIYVTDVNSNFQVSAQPTPASCNVTVQTSQTVTITGSISVGANNTIRIKQLHCSIS